MNESIKGIDSFFSLFCLLREQQALQVTWGADSPEAHRTLCSFPDTNTSKYKQVR